jgi:hypothetical protein
MKRGRKATMKTLLLLFLLAWALPAFPANGASYNWIIEQYRKGDFEYIPIHAEGRIDGEDYVAMFVTRDEPVFLLFKKTVDQFDAIAKVYGFYGSEIDFEIRDNSLFIERWIGRHGMWGRRYQFEQIHRKFRMVGVESTYGGLTYCPYEELSTCDEVRDEFSGTSFNFLTSSALCWKKTFSLDHDKNEKQYKETSRRFNAFLLPKGGLKHRMTFRKMALPLLDGFDPREFSEPATCHFDYKDKLAN